MGKEKKTRQKTREGEVEQQIKLEQANVEESEIDQELKLSFDEQGEHLLDDSDNGSFVEQQNDQSSTETLLLQNEDLQVQVDAQPQDEQSMPEETQVAECQPISVEQEQKAEPKNEEAEVDEPKKKSAKAKAEAEKPEEEPEKAEPKNEEAKAGEPKKKSTKAKAEAEKPEEEPEDAEASGDQRFVEYIYKNNIYLLPPKSVIYGEGPNGYFDVGGKKTKNFAQFLYNRQPNDDAEGLKVGMPVTGIGSSVGEEYKDVASYVKSKKQLIFLEVDHATGTKIALCTFFKPADASRADAFVKEINASLPFLINIFRRPLIHLRQAEIIQPIDAVKRVNHLTIRHLSQHPEHWKSIDEQKNIVPARLLTRVYEDDYNIYENVVFRELIDKITVFLRKRSYSLTQILETFTDSVKLDAVNMFNHRNYYLAIGKLYVGFYGLDDNAGIKNSLETARFLYKKINSYKSRIVYTSNTKLKASAGEVKRTNILTMHKDYRHVLSLSQIFHKQTLNSKEVGNLRKQQTSQNAYTSFCLLLSIFSASNFNLECMTETAILKNGKLNAEFKYKDWELKLKSTRNKLLDFDIISAEMENRDNKFSMAWIPLTYFVSRDNKKWYEYIVKRLYNSGAKYDKYVFLIPFDDDEIFNYCLTTPNGNEDLSYAILPISITELNSFRRVQKLLLEMMVLTNKKNDVCAFCGAKMEKSKSGEFNCVKCKMAIKPYTCSHCGKSFTATYVNAKNTEKEDAYKDLPDLLKQEKLYHFRNIVNMNKNRLLCPCCGTEHSK